MKPFYERDNVTIWCGEAGKIMGRHIDDGSIDLTVTSPPYDNLRTYNGYTFDFERIAGELWRVTTKGGVCVWVVGDATIDGSETGTSFRQALYFRGLGFNLHDTMIYERDNFAKPDNTRYWASFEYMFVFSRGAPKVINQLNDRPNKSSGRYTGNITKREVDNSLTPRNGTTIEKWGKRTNLWRYNSGNGQGTTDNFNHPAPFPEALARDHILSWSNPGDTVLDCFLGSGTTAKMAQQLGRRFVGIEISEEYCRICVDRLRQPSFFSLPSVATVEAKPEQSELW